jgi:Ca2+-dependent lipid-binding protein
MIKGIVNDILDTQKPTFLDELRLTKFTLGSSSPRVNTIRTHTESSPDTLIMDWELNFVPIDDDMAEKLSVRNSHIELLAKIGLIPLTIKVKDIEFKGLVILIY